MQIYTKSNVFTLIEGSYEFCENLSFFWAPSPPCSGGFCVRKRTGFNRIGSGENSLIMENHNDYATKKPMKTHAFRESA